MVPPPLSGIAPRENRSASAVRSITSANRMPTQWTVDQFDRLDQAFERFESRLGDHFQLAVQRAAHRQTVHLGWAIFGATALAHTILFALLRVVP
jgi:hypothetical protein